MNKFTIVILCQILQLLAQYAHSLMEIIIDEKIVNCTKPGVKAGALDFSEFELIAESDTTIFANGSVKFLRSAVLPFKNHVYTEKYERGKWIPQLFDKKFADFCAVKENPKEPSYTYFTHCPKCPFKAGVRSYDFGRKKDFTYLNKYISGFVCFQYDGNNCANGKNYSSKFRWKISNECHFAFRRLH